MLARWKTQVESSLDYLLTTQEIKSSQWEEWLISQGEVLSYVFEGVLPMQRTSENQGTHLGRIDPLCRIQVMISEAGGYQIQFFTCYSLWKHSL